jgi:hypothetical protein
MKARYPLFKRLLASLAAQTNQRYTLLLAVDPATPDKLRRKVVSSTEKSDVPATIVYESPMEWLRKKQPESPYLITSRIDNDDEYLPRFIQVIQETFCPRTEVLDVHGVQCDGHAYYSSGRPAPNSPFLSVVEPWHDVKTAHFENHNKMNEIFPARFVGSDYLFIQHVHASNVRNRIVGHQLAPDETEQLPPLGRRAHGFPGGRRRR